MMFSIKNLVKPCISEDGGAIYLSNANCIKTGLPAEKIENKIDAEIVKKTAQIYGLIKRKALLKLSKSNIFFNKTIFRVFYIHQI